MLGKTIGLGKGLSNTGTQEHIGLLGREGGIATDTKSSGMQVN